MKTPARAAKKTILALSIIGLALGFYQFNAWYEYNNPQLGQFSGQGYYGIQAQFTVIDPDILFENLNLHLGPELPPDMNITKIAQETRTFTIAVEQFTINLVATDPFTVKLRFGVDVRHAKNTTWTPDYQIDNYRIIDFSDWLEITELHRFRWEITSIDTIYFYVDLQMLMFALNADYPIQLNPYLQLQGTGFNGDTYTTEKMYMNQPYTIQAP